MSRGSAPAVFAPEAAGRGRGGTGQTDPVRAGDERVAVYDAAGRVTGAATRGEVYRRGLWHAATGVLVRSGDGERVVLHRRAPDKLVFADTWDCWAGGVVGAGRGPRRRGRP